MFWNIEVEQWNSVVGTAMVDWLWWNSVMKQWNRDVGGAW